MTFKSNFARELAVSERSIVGNYVTEIYLDPEVKDVGQKQSVDYSEISSALRDNSEQSSELALSTRENSALRANSEQSSELTLSTREISSQTSGILVNTSSASGQPYAITLSTSDAAARQTRSTDSRSGVFYASLVLPIYPEDGSNQSLDRLNTRSVKSLGKLDGVVSPVETKEFDRKVSIVPNPADILLKPGLPRQALEVPVKRNHNLHSSSESNLATTSAIRPSLKEDINYSLKLYDEDIVKLQILMECKRLQYENMCIRRELYRLNTGPRGDILNNMAQEVNKLRDHIRDLEASRDNYIKTVLKAAEVLSLISPRLNQGQQRNRASKVTLQTKSSDSLSEPYPTSRPRSWTTGHRSRSDTAGKRDRSEPADNPVRPDASGARSRSETGSTLTDSPRESDRLVRGAPRGGVSEPEIDSLDNLEGNAEVDARSFCPGCRCFSSLFRFCFGRKRTEIGNYKRKYISQKSTIVSSKSAQNIRKKSNSTGTFSTQSLDSSLDARSEVSLGTRVRDWLRASRSFVLGERSYSVEDMEVRWKEQETRCRGSQSSLARRRRMEWSRSYNIFQTHPISSIWIFS